MTDLRSDLHAFSEEIWGALAPMGNGPLRLDDAKIDALRGHFELQVSRGMGAAACDVVLQISELLRTRDLNQPADALLDMLILLAVERQGAKLPRDEQGFSKWSGGPAPAAPRVGEKKPQGTTAREMFGFLPPGPPKKPKPKH
jgi:hypothetical protein